MKKMQCEVCGSNEIKKINDTTFECQSCGIQYSKEEVQKLLVEITGNVKIDHSQEVENAIKRAEQFESAGDNKKAEEYYNKALDMDAENEKAQQRIKEISDNQALEEYYVVDSAVNPKDNVVQFLKQLASTENIACDIYKEISIKSITEKYHTFLFMKNKCECVWSAIACHRYYENETVYETVYRNGRSYQEPKTKKVERIERIPRNGTYIYDSEGLAFASNQIGQRLSLSNTTAKNAILEDFETLQDNKYGSYTPKKIDSRNVKKENGKYFYNGYELDLEIDGSVYTSKRDKILESGDGIAYSHITGQIGGDFYENLQATRHVLSHTVAYVCVPVQVIEYTYKGDNYVAVSDLVSQTTSISKLFPCDAALVESKNQLSTENTKSQKLPGIFIVGIVGFIVGAICLFIAANSSDGDFFGFTAISLWIVSLGLMFGGLAVRGARQKKFAQKSKDAKIAIYNPRMLALSGSYEEYFDVIERKGSFDEARNAVSNTTLTIENTYAELSPAGALKEFSFSSTEATSKEEIAIMEKEQELSELQKKRKTPIIVMVIGFLLMAILGPITLATEVIALSIILMFSGLAMLAIIGPIMLGKINRQIFACNSALKQMRDNWIN